MAESMQSVPYHGAALTVSSAAKPSPRSCQLVTDVLIRGSLLQQSAQSPVKGHRTSLLAAAGWLVSCPLTIALSLVTAAVRPHLIQLVSIEPYAAHLASSPAHRTVA